MRTYPKVYSQRDPLWKDVQIGEVSGSTIGMYGCLLTCHAMKAQYYGYEITPQSLNDIYVTKDLYLSGDLLSDADIHAVFDDIVIVDTRNYVGVPADLSFLQDMAKDPNLTVTLELDFDHDPKDGIQTHFVELHNYDGKILTIYDPWDGKDKKFSDTYGNDPKTTIQKMVVYKGAPANKEEVATDVAKASVVVDGVTYEKLVTNSVAYDGVCDALNVPRNSSKDLVLPLITTMTKSKQDLSEQLQEARNQIKNIQDANTKNAEAMNQEVNTLRNQILAKPISPDTAMQTPAAAKTVTVVTTGSRIQPIHLTGAQLVPVKQKLIELVTRLMGGEKLWE